MGQAQLYLYNDAQKKWIPATTDSLGSGGGGSTSGGTTGGATAANQAEVISRLNTLLSENATEAEQQDIEAAIVALQNAWLAENATEAKQDALIAKTEELRSLLAEVKTRLGDVVVDSTLPDVRSLLKSIEDKQSAEIAWGVPIDDVVTTANKVILPTSPARRHFLICNLDISNYIYLNTDKAASTTSAIVVVQPGQTVVLESDGKAEINAIASSGTINFSYKIGI